ncbi:MAG TPA: thioredoxin family protein [Desulfobacterales bacterium]|nr:thioredoxin family protein [Desulfobacterales bacterium]
MAEREVTQISVGGDRVGIIGLKAVLEVVAREFKGRPDEEIKTELMKLLGRSNYIVPSAEAAYEAAFFREYKKFIGEPVPMDPTGTLQIRVLGPGCPSCDKLEKDLMAVMAELNLPADLDHVRDVKEIACYGVMGNPALVINGKVVAVGRVPSKNQLKEWLKAAWNK